MFESFVVKYRGYVSVMCIRVGTDSYNAEARILVGILHEAGLRWNTLTKEIVIALSVKVSGSKVYAK